MNLGDTKRTKAELQTELYVLRQAVRFMRDCGALKLESTQHALIGKLRDCERAMQVLCDLGLTDETFWLRLSEDYGRPYFGSTAINTSFYKGRWTAHTTNCAAQGKTEQEAIDNLIKRRDAEVIRRAEPLPEEKAA
jgi:hypothetical protein